MVHGGKRGYFLTYQALSPRLSQDILLSVGINADEIVGTRDTSGSCLYAYIHLPSKMTEEVLKGGIMKLASSHGIRETNIFGYDAVASSSTSTSDLIEDHPGFKILVQHQAQGNENFHRWTADGYADANSGYNKLKAKLLSKRTLRQVAGERYSSTNGVGGGGKPEEDSSCGDAPDMGREGSDDEEQSSGQQAHNKRQRQFSPRPSAGSNAREKQPHRSSAYNLPESIPSYMLQFASFNMQETVATAISTMQTSSMSIAQNERLRAEEAESRCKKLEKTIRELDQSKVMSMNKTVHAYYNVCFWLSGQRPKIF